MKRLTKHLFLVLLRKGAVKTEGDGSAYAQFCQRQKPQYVGKQTADAVKLGGEITEKNHSSDQLQKTDEESASQPGENIQKRKRRAGIIHLRHLFRRSESRR